MSLRLVGNPGMGLITGFNFFVPQASLPSFIFLYHPGSVSISFPIEQALKSVDPFP